MPSVNFAIFFIILSAIDVVLSRNVKIKHNVEQPLRHQDKNIEFNCTIDDISDVKAKDIVWEINGKKLGKKDEKYYTISEYEGKSRLFIKKPDISEDSGNVSCQVKTSSGDILSDSINITSEPHVKFDDKSKNLVQGDPLTLKCKVSGSPTPSRILWKGPNEKTLSEVDQRVSFRDNNATLKIKDIDFDDKGTYTCVASNIHGEYNATITVRVKDKLAALWPFLGICAEVFILCSIILIYERSRKKKSSDNTVDDEAGDKLTNSNDNQVRQRRT